MNYQTFLDQQSAPNADTQYPDLGEPPKDWSGWLAHTCLRLVIYLAKDPWGFFMSLFMILTPLLMVSAYCAYKLANEIKRQEQEEKAKAKRVAAIHKAKQHVKAD